MPENSFARSNRARSVAELRPGFSKVWPQLPQRTLPLRCQAAIPITQPQPPQRNASIVIFCPADVTPALHMPNYTSCTPRKPMPGRVSQDEIGSRISADLPSGRSGQNRYLLLMAGLVCASPPVCHFTRWVRQIRPRVFCTEPARRKQSDRPRGERGPGSALLASGGVRPHKSVPPSYQSGL
jgi:hypothetical protein